MGSAEFTFDAAAHKYTLGGRQIPGVTTVLAATKLIDTTFMNDDGRQRGTAVHYGVELYLRNQLDWSTVDERIKPYLDAAVQFFADVRFDPATITHLETKVVHRALGYAGTIDLVGTLFGEPCLVDVKTGAAGAVGPQTAAYDMAVRSERPGSKPMRRMALLLKPTGKYQKMDLRRGDDYTDFLSALSIYQKYHINSLGKESNHGTV